jgi:hypothetical protein
MKLRRLERDVELRAVPDPVELDPVGVRQPLLAEAHRRGGPGQKLVVRAPHDAHRAGDLRRVELVARAQRVVEHRRRTVAAGHPAHHVREQLGRDVLEVRRERLRRPAAPFGRRDDLVGVGRRSLHLCKRVVEVGGRVGERVVRPRPAAGRRQRDDRLRPPACRQLEREEAAERVAGDVRRREAGLVHRPLERVRERGGAELALEPGPTRVAGERRREHVVLPLERRQDEIPGAPGVGEAVHTEEGRARPAAVERREARVHERTQ